MQQAPERVIRPRAAESAGWTVACVSEAMPSTWSLAGKICCDAQTYVSPNDMVGCGPHSRGAHEAARVHHPFRRSRSLLATGRAGAARRANATDRGAGGL